MLTIRDWKLHGQYRTTSTKLIFSMPKDPDEMNTIAFYFRFRLMLSWKDHVGLFAENAKAVASVLGKTC